MTGWIAGLEGTPDGRLAAMALALLAAVSHAIFGALQKGRHDPWLTRGAIDTTDTTGRARPIRSISRGKDDRGTRDRFRSRRAARRPRSRASSI